MAPNRNLSGPVAGQLLDRLRHGGKKTAVAGALSLIMLFMWVRVFLGHRPAAADAAPQAVPAATVPLPAPAKVRPVELPKLPGRHDAIARDFFTVKNRGNSSAVEPDTETEVPVTSTPNVSEVIQRIAQTMKLEAVLWNESPRAFINERQVGVGGKFLVKDGTATYEFEVLQIHANSVLVECKGIQLTLVLAPGLEVVR